MAKMRSPNYPAMGLGEAIQRVKALWAKEKRTAVSYDVAVMAIGYSGLSGPSRTALAAIKKYGLVDSDDRMVRVSDLALQIIHPASENAALNAVQEAALRPELFHQLYETHAHASDDALRSYLINKLDFSESGARQVIKAFRDTMEVAKLDQTQYNPDGEQGDESVEVQQNKTVNSMSGTNFGTPVFGTSNTAQRTDSNVFSWPLASDVRAEVKITGGELKPEYFEALKRYIDVAKTLIQPAFQEGDKVEYPDAHTGEIRYGVIDRMYGGDAIIRTITKEEAGPNPKKFVPKPALAKQQ